MSVAEARPADAPAPAAAAADVGLFDALRALLHELPGLVSDRVHLLSLELKRAGRALLQIVALAVAAAVLLITAWLALWAGIAAGLVQAGLPWGWALLLVTVLNLGAAALAVRRALALVGLLGLPATVRRLTVRRPGDPADEPAAA